VHDSFAYQACVLSGLPCDCWFLGLQASAAKDWRGIRLIPTAASIDSALLTGHATQPPLARFASDGRDAPCLHEEKTHTTKEALKFVIGRRPCRLARLGRNTTRALHFVKLIA
jgi:hypothetical protein